MLSTQPNFTLVIQMTDILFYTLGQKAYDRSAGLDSQLLILVHWKKDFHSAIGYVSKYNNISKPWRGSLKISVKIMSSLSVGHFC